MASRSCWPRTPANGLDCRSRVERSSTPVSSAMTDAGESSSAASHSSRVGRVPDAQVPSQRTSVARAVTINRGSSASFAAIARPNARLRWSISRWSFTCQSVSRFRMYEEDGDRHCLTGRAASAALIAVRGAWLLKQPWPGSDSSSQIRAPRNQGAALFIATVTMSS